MRNKLLSESATPEPPGQIRVKTHNQPSTISLIKKQTASPATLALYFQIDTAYEDRTLVPKHTRETVAVHLELY